MLFSVTRPTRIRLLEFACFGLLSSKRGIVIAIGGVPSTVRLLGLCGVPCVCLKSGGSSLLLGTLNRFLCGLEI